MRYERENRQLTERERAERARRRAAAARRRRRRMIIKRIRLGCAACLLLIAIGIISTAGQDNTSSSKGKNTQQASSTANSANSKDSADSSTNQDGDDASATPKDSATLAEEERQALIAEADRLSAGYDYDAAIELIESYEDYADFSEMTEAIESYETAKASAVKYEDVTEITHIFYHSLIVDTSLAFDGDSNEKGYNEVMTTVDEFKAIMQEMYDRGYVLVSIHDIGHIEIQEDGTKKMVEGEIYLPEGKIPYVLSQDDVSYYHYMQGDGFATKIVLDEDGKPTCEYIEEDGTVVYGDYDMIPLVDSFIEEHPDASYRGARGIIALTGYNGILGYRTNPNYQTEEGLDNWQQTWLDENPDYDFDEECANASKVAEALKEDGWEFASHSYGHRYYGQISEEDFIWDSNRWEETVEPLIGDTDIIIFAFGDDIGDWYPYTSDNSRYVRLKELGFDYFCNVDSSQYWVQFGEDYLRQGRRNIDGTRMWEALSGGKDRLSDLFDVKEVFDPARPTPVT